MYLYLYCKQCHLKNNKNMYVDYNFIELCTIQVQIIYIIYVGNAI